MIVITMITIIIMTMIRNINVVPNRLKETFPGPIFINSQLTGMEDNG